MHGYVWGRAQLIVILAIFVFVCEYVYLAMALFYVGKNLHMYMVPRGGVYIYLYGE